MIDVLVIGAGPTGLMMAAEAARFGLSCRIIDKSRMPSEKSKALAIQPRTLEIFDHLGIIDQFLSRGLKIQGANPISGTRKLAHFSFKSLDSPYPFILGLEQSETEKILTEHLSSFGIKIEREVELIDLKQEEALVRAIVQDNRSGKEERIKVKWLVGCDGAHSLTRKLLDFPFEGEAIPTVFSLADVHLDWEYPHNEFFAFLNAKGILAVIPMPGQNRFRLVFQLERSLQNSGIDADPTLEEIQQKVNASIGSGVRVSNPIWLANFHINSRLAGGYQKGRVFLAGDAAHIHSPVGGQGMNSGLQDAFNLGWKLATGSKEVIDTYALERLSWGRTLINATRRFTYLATLRNPALIFLRNLLIRIAAPNLESKLTRAIAQLSIRYPKSLIVQESGGFSNGPTAGTRAPNIAIGNTDLYSIMRKSTLPHVLLFGGCTEKSFESNKVISLVIEDEEAMKIYGVKKPSVYFIRPDQYIGHRSTDY